MFSVHDWAEARRLHHREHLSKSAIARRLGMSRPTVIRLLERADPPRYVRRPSGSKLDPHKDAIAEMLDQDAEVPATVILNHLRHRGYDGGISILNNACLLPWQWNGPVELLTVDHNPSYVACNGNSAG